MYCAASQFFSGLSTASGAPLIWTASHLSVSGSYAESVQGSLDHCPPFLLTSRHTPALASYAKTLWLSYPYPGLSAPRVQALEEKS